MHDDVTDRHRGETVYVVGKGASLRGFDFGRLRGKAVIAVNSAILQTPWAHWLFMDTEAIFHRADCCAAFRGDLIFLPRATETLLPAPLARHAGKLRPYRICTGQASPGRQWGAALHYANSSISMAIHTAWIMGARKIEILGMDLGRVPGMADYSIDPTDAPMDPEKPLLIADALKPLLKAVNGRRASELYTTPEWRVRVRVNWDKWGSVMNRTLAALADENLVVCPLDEV